MRHLAAALFAGGLLAACGGDGDDRSAPGWVPTDVLVVDLDGDQLQDVLTLAMYDGGTGADKRTGRLLVYLQTSPGAFAAPQEYAVGRYPRRMAVGDVDGDGAPDVVLVDSDDALTLLLRQDAANRGRLLDPQELLAGVESHAVLLADLDGDGAPDIAVGDAVTQPGRLVVRYQDRDRPGAFGAPVDIPMPGAPTDLAAGDVDGDGRIDLFAWVVTSPAQSGRPLQGAMALGFQQSDGAFEMFRTLDAREGLAAACLAVADIDGDGLTDLFASLSPSGAGFRGAFVSIRQLAFRAFAPAVDTPLEGLAGTADAVLAKLGRGSLPEVGAVRTVPAAAPGGSAGSMASFYANAGGGQFSFRSSSELPVETGRVAAGDLNGDGRVDLVFLGSDNQAFAMHQSPTVAGSFDAARPLR